ncbi:MAG: YggS family pyridoxal phosphate-dependent enzyme [Parasphingorhabdus sp.]
MSALQEIQERMAKASRLAGRNATNTQLIAISKTRSVEEIRPLLESGHRLFGENRVQEAADKWSMLREEYPDVKVHLVGQLQSNKAEEAVEHFDAIHSLDRKSLLKALAKAMQKSGKHIPCFVQINIGEESQKGGCDISEAEAFLQAVSEREIDIAGLMCLPPSGANPAPYFALLAKLAKDNRLSGLSMGMSADFETAIKLGATHVRVGTALFGPRKP